MSGGLGKGRGAQHPPPRADASRAHPACPRASSWRPAVCWKPEDGRALLSYSHHSAPQELIPEEEEEKQSARRGASPPPGRQQAGSFRSPGLQLHQEAGGVPQGDVCTERHGVTSLTHWSHIPRGPLLRDRNSPARCPGERGCPPSPSLGNAGGSVPVHPRSLQRQEGG